jgi:hypothetical protein
MRRLFLLALLLCAASAFAQVSPIQALGNIQLLDNNGKPATAGCLYFYAAGTSTQQATYTDSTGTVQNTNPVCFGSGARAQIWLTSTLFYKVVACLANDGPTCAPADVLFSVDQVPGGPSAGGTGNVFTGTFISASPSPSTTGVLRLASGDSICWRNAAGTANLCISKDGNDVLSWAGGDFKMPEINCVANQSGFDFICADSSTHRFKMSLNAGSQLVVVGIAAAGTAGHLATIGASGYDIQDGGSPPSTTLSLPNDTISGTTTNTVTKVSSNGGGAQTAIIATTSDTNGAIGICVSNCGSTGSANIAVFGSASCVFDGGTTVNDYVILSNSAGGDCHDSGVAPPQYPNSGQVIGRVQSNNAGAGTYTIDLFPAENRGQLPIVASDTTTSLGAPATIAGSPSSTVVITKALTMPSIGCPCRVDAQWNTFWATTAAGEFAAWVSDGTNQFATSSTSTTGSSSHFGVGGSGSSLQTYANGANVTFTLNASQDAGGTVTVNTVSGVSAATQATFLNLRIFRNSN